MECVRLWDAEVVEIRVQIAEEEKIWMLMCKKQSTNSKVL